MIYLSAMLGTSLSRHSRQLSRAHNWATNDVEEIMLVAVANAFHLETLCLTHSVSLGSALSFRNRTWSVKCFIVNLRDMESRWAQV